MRKYFFMAMVIGLAFLSACKKDSGTTSGGNDAPVDISGNYIYKQFRFAESLLGLDSATVDKMLADSGYPSGFMDSFMWYYRGDDLATVGYSEYIDDEWGREIGVKGKSVEATIHIRSSYLYNKILQNDFLDFIKYIGQSYKMASGENCYFNCVNGVGDSGGYLQKDYDSAMNNFGYLYSMEAWIVYWGYTQTFDEEHGPEEAIVLWREYGEFNDIGISVCAK